VEKTVTEEEIKNQEQLQKKEPPEPPKSLPVSARPITSPMSALSGLSVAELLDQVDQQAEYEYDYTDASSNGNNQEYTYEEYTDEEYQNGKLKSPPPPSSSEV